VHLVLARTPAAPEGTRGLSVFVVPKVRVAEDGTLGDRNAVRAMSIERKLGIHASPTCVMHFDGAHGELVGPLHGGLSAMFTMMNAARLYVAQEGLAIAERAWQQARDHATTRLQGRIHGEPAVLADHLDVRRMLLTIRTHVLGMRHLLYAAVAAADLAEHHPDPARRASAAARLDLLTPIAKSWCTDTGVAMSSLALQVHGGMGYVEETGIAQRLRDARIAPIYEGTNGIQAIDLVLRKVRRDRGAAMFAALDDAPELLAALRVHGLPTEHLASAIADLLRTTTWLCESPEADGDAALAGASSYLELAAIVLVGCQLGRAALRAQPSDGSDDFAAYTFAASEMFPRASAAAVAAREGVTRRVAITL
jgi:hypothetical protein